MSKESSKNVASISRLQPLYLYLLFDCSGSMGEDGGTDSMKRTKATSVMDAASDLLQEAYLIGLSGSTYKNYIYVSATGYCHYGDVPETNCLFQFKEDTPTLVKTAPVLSIYDFIKCCDEDTPILVEPKGQTPMKTGFEKAKADILEFDAHCHEFVLKANPGLNVKPDAVRPRVLILHCTDGRFDNLNNGAALNLSHANSPRGIVEEIMALKLKHISEITIMNLYLSSAGTEESIIFPSSVPDDDPFLSFLSEISSELTPDMLQAASSHPELGILHSGARALAYNVCARDLYKIFSLGTQVTLPSITSRHVTNIN